MIRVIVVNYRQPDYTIKCIDSILQSTGVDIKILVIDNGASKEENDYLRQSLPREVETYWSEKNIGYVGGVNIGLEKSLEEKAEYTLIMNNDTIIDREAVANLVRCAQRYNNDCIVSGKVYHYDNPDTLQYIGSKLIDKKLLMFERIVKDEIDNGQYDTEMDIDMIDDVFWLLPYKVVSKVGFYSSCFWFNYEQADYALRAEKKGFKLIYTPESKIWHKGSISIGGLTDNPARAFWDMKSNLILRFIHLKRHHFIHYLAIVIYHHFKAWIKNTIKVVLNRSNKKKLHVHYARTLAIVHFLRWKKDMKPDNGILPKSVEIFTNSQAKQG